MPRRVVPLAPSPVAMVTVSLESAIGDLAPRRCTPHSRRISCCPTHYCGSSGDRPTGPRCFNPRPVPRPAPRLAPEQALEPGPPPGRVPAGLHPVDGCGTQRATATAGGVDVLENPHRQRRPPRRVLVCLPGRERE